MNPTIRSITTGKRNGPPQKCPSNSNDTQPYGGNLPCRTTQATMPLQLMSRLLHRALVPLCILTRLHPLIDIRPLLPHRAQLPRDNKFG
jgi:hypothetical protein